MNWRDFIDIEIIALVSKHVSGAVALIIGFGIIGETANWIINDPIVSPVIHYVETVIALACLLRAVIVMLWEITRMTKKTVKGGDDGTTASLLVG